MRPPTRVPNGLRVVAALSIATGVAACSGGERSRASDSATKSVEAVPPSPTSGAASRPAGDSVGIINRTGAVLLSVARDSVSMGFSPATIAKVRRETDTTGSGSGFGAMIERTVKSGVQTMLSTRIMVPLADIENVRYEDGTIKFDYRTRAARHEARGYQDRQRTGAAVVPRGRREDVRQRGSGTAASEVAPPRSSLRPRLTRFAHARSPRGSAAASPHRAARRSAF